MNVIWVVVGGVYLLIGTALGFTITTPVRLLCPILWLPLLIFWVWACWRGPVSYRK